MIEKIATFGHAQSMLGIVMRPDVESTARDAAFVLPNAGVIHRIGPGRLNVRLARRLAGQGFTSLRFDLSGIGDSRPPQGTLSFEAQAVADLRSAMDYLESTLGLCRFVLAGLCSGADNSYAAGVADVRVTGLVLLDPNTYPTWKTRPRFLLLSLGHPRWLASAVRRRFARLLGGPHRPSSPSSAEVPKIQPNPDRYVRPTPPIAEFAAGLASILDRGGSVLAVYSGSSLRRFNHQRQLDEALAPFGLAGRVECRLWPHVNHTFTELSAQSQLVDTIAGWAGGLRA
jgi:pimeloyl-ACP methyl ester carboxylesterase